MRFNKIKFRPTLKEEAKQDPKADIQPDDLATPPEIAKEPELKVVRELKQQFTDAAASRASKEPTMYESMAFERGNQYVEWDKAARKLRAVLTDPEDSDYFKKVNLIRPLILKNTARATQNEPDVDFVPKSESKRDMAAAAEMRAIRAYCSAKFDRKALIRQMVYAAQITSTVWLKVCWDANAEAEMPRFGPDGQEAGSFTAPVGDIQEYFCLPFEVFLDPDARNVDEARYLIHAKVRPLSYVQEKYGKKGFAVRSDGRTGYATDFESRLNSITGDNGGDARGDHDLVTVLERWEKPSPKYPTGRLTVVAGERLMYNGAWPYEKKDKFPFVPLGYQADLNTPWYRNLVQDLVPLQQALNQAFSHMMARVRRDKLTLLVPEGAEIGVDAFTSDRDYARVYFKQGFPPQFGNPPGDWGKYQEVISYCYSAMQDIVGIHDVSMGQAPTDVKSGVALNILKMGDDTQVSEFIAHIESAEKQVAEWEVSLFRQYASEPRMMAVDDSADVQEAEARIMTFKALKGGGQASVRVVPGSAMPTYPQAEEERLANMFQMGLLGQPGTPEATESYFELDQSLRSDALIDRIVSRMRQREANQPNPEQAAAQQQQQQAAQQAQLQQQQAAMQAQQQQAQMQAEAERHQAEMEAQAAQEQARQQHEAELLAAKSHADIEKMQAQADIDAKLRVIDHQHAMEVKQFEAENPRLAGSLDPTALVDRERQIGLKGAVPPPPKPAPAAPKGKPTPPKGR